ncbi:hypothetical protein MNBD_ALPHA03-1930 [hydrothermal vent metagenome]|uniref:Uncharacterized protein n=1 Tax=hydrothermal vent metagenome TaxID=652676 RepID=A0A3B1BN26_9ZZZZ
MIKKILVPGLMLCLMGLPGCNILSVKSARLEICEKIAKARLKHPSSFDKISAKEYNNAAGHRDATINFKAWNDYKVPIPYNITCVFKSSEPENTPSLISITWNGRHIRNHELDDIREKLKE